MKRSLLFLPCKFPIGLTKDRGEVAFLEIFTINGETFSSNKIGSLGLVKLKQLVRGKIIRKVV